MNLSLHTIKGKSAYSFFKLFYLFLFLLSSYVVKAQVWENEISSDGSIPIHRHECAYIEVDGKFYLLGGREAGVKKFVNIYDPVSKKWTQGSNSDIPIHHFQPVVFNHKIYIVASFTGNFPTETPVPNVYIYDPATDTWSKGPEIPQDRRRGSAGAVLFNNKIYVAGGIVNGHTSGFVNWLDEFDPVTNTWTALSDAPNARDHFQAAIIDNKMVVAAGRQTSTAVGGNLLVAPTDVYDFTTKSWTTKQSVIPTKRAGPAVVVVENEMYVMGGESPFAPAGKAHSETEIYNLGTDTWRSAAKLNTGRHATGALFFNGSIFIVAGSSTSGGNASSELSSQEVLRVKDQTNVGKITLDNFVDFGQVVNKESKDIQIPIRNTSSTKDVTISQITISGEDRNDFTIQNVNTPLVVKANESATITVRFDPLTIGTKTAILTIVHDGENSSSTVDLIGESVLTITATFDPMNNPIKIYPNPFMDQVTLDLSDLNQEMVIKMYDSYGKLSKSCSTSEKNVLLNTSDLMKGIYFIQFTKPNGDTIHSIKLVKK